MKPAVKKGLAGTIAVGAGIVWWFHHSSIPTYQGKSVREWVHEMAFPAGSNTTNATYGVQVSGSGRITYSFPASIPASGNLLMAFGARQQLPDPEIDALKAFGREAVPELIALINKNRRRGFLKIYDQLYWSTPLQIRKHLPNYSSKATRMLHCATSALPAFGDDARQAVPVLLQCSVSEMDYLIPSIITVINEIGVDADQVEPVIKNLIQQGRYDRALKIIQTLRIARTETLCSELTKILQKSGDFQTRYDALGLLRQGGDAAEVAIPTLIQCLRDPDNKIRFLSVWALETIGPGAAVALDPLNKALEDPDPMVQSAARSAIREISPAGDDQ